MLSADPVFQEFHGRGVPQGFPSVIPERGMTTSAVVERFDVVEKIDLSISPRTVAGAMHPLILQAVEEARFVPVFDSRQVVGQGLATGTAGVDSAWRRSSLAGSDLATCRSIR